MREELITMSTKELDRASIIQLVLNRQLTQLEAAQKLGEYNHLKISKETARHWMIKAGFWQAKKSRIAAIH